MGQLGDAGEAMGEAEGQFGEGDADSAVDSQGRALEAMRKGAQGLAQSMQQQGRALGPGRPGRGQAQRQEDTDPLGRPMRGRDYGDDVTVKVPGEIDAQRARRSWKNCASASAKASARSSNSTTSSGCSRTSDQVKTIGRQKLVPPDQRFAHGAGDLIDRKWFCEHIVHERIQPVRAFMLVSKAGHQHDRDVGMVATGLERESDAVHDRHFYVCQEQVEVAIGLVERLERAAHRRQPP